MSKYKGILKKFILSTLAAIVVFILTLIVNLLIFENNASKISIGTPINDFQIPRPALLVIDVQEASTGAQSLNQYYIDKSEEFIKNINFASNLFYNNNLPIVYIRSEITNPLINLLNNSFAKGSNGAQFDKRLKILSNIEIVKSRNDAFFNTNLDNTLQSNNINTLYITGLDAAHCINITLQAALNRNYKIRLLKEAILSESVQMKDSMFVEFEKRGMERVELNNLNLANINVLK